MKHVLIAAVILAGCVCPKPAPCPPEPVPCPLSPACVLDAPGQPSAPAGALCPGGTCDGAGRCCPAK